MSKVAVVAHARKSLGGGPPGLRQVVAREGVTDPLWYKVRKSRKASKYAPRAELVVLHYPRTPKPGTDSSA